MDKFKRTIYQSRHLYNRLETAMESGLWPADESISGVANAAFEKRLAELDHAKVEELQA